MIRQYLIDKDVDKEPEYLFVTPYCNGCEGIIKRIPDRAKRIIVGYSETETKLFELFDAGVRPKNILFNNVSPCTPKTRKFVQKNDINVSSYELGWFPHRQTWHFDPWGFSDKSMLAQSRLDNVEIDHDAVSADIESHKSQYMIDNKDMKLRFPYILLVFQHTKDTTVTYGYPEFTKWQDIIEFADKMREHSKMKLVIKMHPQNKGKAESIIPPPNCLIVQSKEWNPYILENAVAVVGINSTMLYEASLLYDKPVVALGSSWFDVHHEVVKKWDISCWPVVFEITKEEIAYRKKMFYIMKAMQTMTSGQLVASTTPFIDDFLAKHHQAAQVKKIEDWVNNA